MTREAFNEFQVPLLGNRYLPPHLIKKALATLDLLDKSVSLGVSVQGREIDYLQIGSGSIRVLMWSQMHGNESTTTRALFDALKYIQEEIPDLLERLTLGIIPMLNPDGAFAYTRENANSIDLNRDAVNLSQPESQILKQVYDEFSPQFCFNLHDQRTIYNVGGRPAPATLSFLAPAFDTDRSVGSNRSEAMKLIAAIHRELSEDLPGGIGLYDDSYNPNCVGDSFQKQGSATLLFEAGHFPGDYHRHNTRYFVFRAMITALEQLAKGEYRKLPIQSYNLIPRNSKDYVDLLIHNPSTLGYPDDRKKIAIQYAENLESGAIVWSPQLAEPELSTATFGHLELDANTPADRIYIEKRPELVALLRQH